MDAIRIGGCTALTSTEVIGDRITCEVHGGEAGRALIREAVPGASASVTIGRHTFEGRIRITDPGEMVTEVEL
jgi:hypothetical protein